MDLKIDLILEVGSNWKHIDDFRRSIDFARSVGALTKGQLWRTDKFIKKSNKDWDVYKRYEVPREWVSRLAANDVFWTAFDMDSLMFLRREVNQQFYKVACLDSNQKWLIQAIASTHKPAFMSCGVYGLDSVRQAARWYSEAGNLFNLTMMHCVVEYPTKDAQLGYMRDRLNGTRILNWGLSYNGNNPLVPALSVAMGGSAVEVHFKLDHISGTPDAPHSMSQKAVKQMLRYIKEAQENIGNGDRPLPCELPHITAGGRKVDRKR